MNDQNPKFSYMSESPFSQYQNTEINDEVPDTRVENARYEKNDITKEDSLVFDLINVPPSHVNALRRTLLADVPSMAFDLIGIDQNTSVMPDEVMCHRIGLIPLNVDSNLFQFPPVTPNPEIDDNPNIVMLFGLHVIGGEGPTPDYSNADYGMEGNLPPTYTGPSGKVMSSHLVYMPFPNHQLPVTPSVLHDDIEITHLLPGQEVHLYARAYKGTGAIHAKFSPVCTAYYRSLPLIKVDPSISDEYKRILVHACPRKVFDIEEASGMVVPTRFKDCTMCRECTRHKRLAPFVKLDAVPNSYEFTVESLGVKPAPQLVKEALQILRGKAMSMKDAVEAARPK